MKAREARALSPEELAQRIRELKGELFYLRLQAVTGNLDNPMRIREVKRDIARLKTIQRQRELGLIP